MSQNSENPANDSPPGETDKSGSRSPRTQEFLDRWFPDQWFPSLRPLKEGWSLPKLLERAGPKLWVLFVYAVIYFGFIFAAATLAQKVWIPSTWWDWKLFFEVLGMFLALLAFVFAERAFNKAKETQSQLVEYIFATGENKTKFQDIFDYHLVNRLKQFRSTGARIILLLSTPAYGYAVVGPSKFETFVDALRGVHDDCELQVMFFSPGDHFHYWANVLIWSRIRKKDHGEKFAILFSKGLRDVCRILRDRKQGHCRVWITRATTVRLFAFLPMRVWDQTADEVSEERIYVAHTDLFCVSQNQYRDRFKARSIRISSALREEFVNSDESYFERIKVCPYTGRDRDQGCLYKRGDTPGATEEYETRFERLMDDLFVDYVLGRTKHIVLDKESFRSEIDALLISKDVVELFGQTFTESMLLGEIIGEVAAYFASLSGNALIEQKLTPTQAGRIKTAIESRPGLPLGAAAKDQLLSFVRQKAPTPLTVTSPMTPAAVTPASGSIGPSVAVVPSPAAAAPALSSPASGSAASLSKESLVECLWELISSGFGQSSYATAVIEEAKQTLKRSSSTP